MTCANHYEHPVLTNRVIIRTPQMSILSDTIHRWVWSGVPGGAIIGESRMGKSWAVRELAERIRTRSNMTIPTDYISLGERDSKSILSIFRRICYSTNLRVTTRSTSDELCRAYVNLLRDRARETGCDYCVLIVDEAHLLRGRQFSPFLEIYNELDATPAGPSIHVIFVFSHPECRPIMDLLKKETFTKVRARFFTQNMRFRGIHSLEQMKICLSAYDQLKFPQDGLVYSNYFLPEWYSQGWRLENLSPVFWEAYNTYKNRMKLDSLGMQYFVSATNMLLADILPRLSDPNIESEIIEDCLAVSGL